MHDPVKRLTFEASPEVIDAFRLIETDVIENETGTACSRPSLCEMIEVAVLTYVEDL